jgi:hypothetical protein
MLIVARQAILEWIDEANRLGRDLPVPGANGFFKKPEFRKIAAI